MRKSKFVVVPLEGRDKHKRFLLTEMPAAQAEKWAARAFIALKGSESRIPLEFKSLGMVGIAIVGFNVFLQSSVRFGELEPLMDEMFDCVQAVPDPKHPESPRVLLEDDIQEVATRAWLRAEVLELHTGFSVVAALSRLISALKMPEDLPTG